MATYPLRVHQFTTQRVKDAKGGMNSHSSNTISNHEYAKTCSFKGNLPTKSLALYPGLLTPEFVACSTNMGGGLVKLRHMQ